MSDASQSSDEELVRRVRAGDEAAARLLFERHLPALRAKARARLPKALRGKVAESDVIQEAWLAAYLALGKFEDRGDGSFGRWLRGIVEHKVREESHRHLGAACPSAPGHPRQIVRRRLPAAVEVRAHPGRSIRRAGNRAADRAARRDPARAAHGSATCARPGGDLPQ